MYSMVAILFGTLAMAAFGIVVGQVFAGVDRILAARMQARVGPPLRQPFLDLFKLFTKENIVPGQAVAWLFNAAPVFALVSSVAVLLYLPVGGWAPLLSAHGDLILVLYLFILPALAMVVGGLASSSPYATIGSQRELVTMVAYELPLATVAMTVVWILAKAGIAHPFSIAVIAAHPVWAQVGPIGFAGCVLLLLTLLLVTPGKLSRVPFDTAEAETELAGGLLVEYSGRNLALFYLALGTKTVGISALVIALFFPYGLSGPLGLGAFWGGLVDLAFFLLKLLVIVFAANSLVRVSVARLRINHVVDFYWKILGVTGLLGLALVAVDMALK